MSDPLAALPPADLHDADVLLRTRGLTKRFGGVAAIDGLDLVIRRGEVCGIIGPNGAGKSTLVGLLGGAIRPTAGIILFDGTDITTLPAAARARAGIGRTYQIPRPFPDMTVRENLLAALFGVAPTIGRQTAHARCGAILERAGLADVADLEARALPLLRRKRLELARALALKPKLLLLDEVGAGLIDSELTELIALIHALTAEIESIVIVEHVMRVVKACSSRLVVLNFGRRLVEGATAEVLASDDVGAVYLGTSHRSAGTASQSAADGAPTPEQADASAGLGEVVAPRAAAAAEHGLLRLAGIHAGYGQARVLHDISFTLAPGQAVAILGTNGAGKTTLANVVSGTIRPTAGRMTIAGRDVTGWPAHRIAGLGVTQSMEGRRIFSGLTVEENLLIAGRGIDYATQQRRLGIIYGLFPSLERRRAIPGTAMSGGEQQMLAIGRALMARPRLVVFDEISLGLAPVIVDRLYAALAELRRAGLSMLIVEQDVDRALDLVDYVHVLERGTLGLSGTPAEVRGDPRLRNLYIGVAD